MSKEQPKVKVGIVGCGVVATAYYLPYLMKMPNAQIVAVCDLSEDRIKACKRLFGAKETYTDYFDMLAKADIEAVFILTGPGTHASFTIAAVEAGKHVLLQKPMATNLEDAIAIQRAVRKRKVIALVEPSEHSPMDYRFAEARKLIQQGVLGDPYWFALIPRGHTKPNAMSGGNPYGVGAFFSKDSGGMLFDYPYFPTTICNLLGNCKSVQGLAKTSVATRYVVPDDEYNKFLKECDDPESANYWPVVLHKEKTQRVEMGAPDNVYSLYEMSSGWIGACHVGRLFAPAHPTATYGNLEIYGSKGNMLIQTEKSIVSVNSSRTDLLPETDEDGWYNIPKEKGVVRFKGPVPPDGTFNYYHASSEHFIDCVLKGKDPVANVEWGLHITEMMCGALISSESGRRYEMTTTTEGYVKP